MKEYPIWTEETPHTDPKARIKRYRVVTCVRVIKVKNASYRSAPLNAVFELENQNKNEHPIDIKPSGKVVAKVVCAWHGVVPPTTYPQLNLTVANYTILDDYTGEVADNIA